MNFLSILWDEVLHDKTAQARDSLKFDVKEHETLKDAVVYLIKNGANYQNQKIVKEVDWLPNGSQPLIEEEKPKNEDLRPPQSVVSGPAEQPQTLDFTKPHTHTNIEKKRSIFDGVLPQNLIPIISADKD